METVDPTSTAVKASSHRRRRTWPQRFLLTLGVVSTSMAVFAAGVLAWGNAKLEAIPTISIASVEKAEPGEAANWLLVGTDSREGIDPNDPNAGIFLGEDVGGKRTDSIIIARVDPANNRIDLLSLPRDLYVPISGTGGTDRINTAFVGDGGPDRLVSTIEENFGIDINHYAEVNFVGFQDLVDSLGGVPMWFDKPMRDAGSALDISVAGCHVLDGFQALAFARSRHLEYFENGEWQSDPTGDLGRTSRQQYFLRRVVDTARSTLDVTKLGTVNNLLDTGGKNLTIDEGVQPSDLLTLGQTFASLGGDQIIGHALPVENFRTNDGKAVLRLFEDEAQPTFDIFRGIVPAAPTDPGAEAGPALVAKILSGSSVAGQAADASERATIGGFEIAEVGNSEATFEQTTIRFAPADRSVAEALAASLGFAPLLIEDETVGVVTTHHRKRLCLERRNAYCSADDNRGTRCRCAGRRCTNWGGA
ncbi:MAG: LCP family protein [Acidimicrobiales bacterium]